MLLENESCISNGITDCCISSLASTYASNLARLQMVQNTRIVAQKSLFHPLHLRSGISCPPIFPLPWHFLFSEGTSSTMCFLCPPWFHCMHQPSELKVSCRPPNAFQPRAYTISSLLHSCPGLATYWRMCKCCVTYLLRPTICDIDKTCELCLTTPAQAEYLEFPRHSDECVSFRRHSWPIFGF